MKIDHHAGTYSELGNVYVTTRALRRQFSNAAAICRGLMKEISEVFHHQFYSAFNIKKAATTTNKSAITAEELISQSTGLCLNQVQKEEKGGLLGCLAVLPRFLLNEQDHTAHLRAGLRLL